MFCVCACGVLLYIFMCSATVCVIVFGWLVCVASPVCLPYDWVGLGCVRLYCIGVVCVVVCCVWCGLVVYVVCAVCMVL